jgi:uncharacterized protein (TIGR00725 family)
MATPCAMPADGAGASSSPPSRTLVIFGASWCAPGSALYEESVKVGALAASAGWRIVNGGYGGTMEGSAKGAALAKGEAEGVIVTSLFTARGPGGNPYLTTTTDTPSLMARIAYLADAGAHFLVLPGTLGTLTELAVVWNLAALAPVGGYTAATILAYRAPWEGVVAGLAQGLALPAAHAGLVRFVEGAEEAVAALEEDFAARVAAAAAGGGGGGGGGAGAWPGPSSA